MPQDPRSDEEIAEMVQGGDRELFGALVDRYETKLIRYGGRFLSVREDTKDLVQEIFIKAYRNMHSFDAGKKFSPWIYRIAHNEFINYLKKKGKEPLIKFDLDSFLPHLISEQETDKNLMEKEEIESMNKCLDKLNPELREFLIFYYYEEMSYQEISEVLKIPISTVGVKIHRAKKSLKEICKQNHE